MQAGLYARLLGSDWSRLDETVRRFHVVSTPVRASGSFRVRHGNSMMAKWLLWLLDMPPAGEAVPAPPIVCSFEGGGRLGGTLRGRAPPTTSVSLRNNLLSER